MSCDQAHCKGPGLWNGRECKKAQGPVHVSDPLCLCLCHRQKICAVDGCNEPVDPRYQMHRLEMNRFAPTILMVVLACEGHGEEAVTQCSRSDTCQCPSSTKEIV